MIKTETMTTAQGPGSDIPSCVWHWELPGLQGSRNEDTQSPRVQHTLQITER